MTRKRAPTAVVGFHASLWATGVDVGLNTDPGLDVATEAKKQADYLRTIGADQADYLAADSIDRDAGCYEVGGPNCSKRDGVYLDESNAKLPNFRQKLNWVAALSKELSLPMVLWQLPFGVPSASPGGTERHFRDNHTHYLLGHVDEMVSAGLVAAVWGTGAGGQTDVTTDGDAFKTAVHAYYAAPVPLQ
jgi:hypothetical protein